MKRNYTFKNKLWLWPGEQGNWHFLSLPKSESAAIKENFGKQARGFRSLKVEVTIGKTVWQTSIFPDSKSGCYVLPIKAKVRKAEDIEAGEEVTFTVKLI